MIEQKDRNTIFDNIHKLTVYDIRDMFCTDMIVADLFKDRILANTNATITDVIDCPHIVETFVLQLERLAKIDGEFNLKPNPFDIFGAIKFTMKSYSDMMRLYRNYMGLEKFTKVVCGVASVLDVK